MFHVNGDEHQDHQEQLYLQDFASYVGDYFYEPLLSLETLGFSAKLGASMLHGVKTRGKVFCIYLEGWGHYWIYSSMAFGLIRLQKAIKSWKFYHYNIL